MSQRPWMALLESIADNLDVPAATWVREALDAARRDLAPNNQGKGMRFFLGTHTPGWLSQVNIPWFVSVKRLIDRKEPLPNADWMMDSGGFSELHDHGRYTISEEKYLECIARHRPPVAFCQDWMCEAMILEKTGKTIQEHQELTVESYLSLSARSDVIRPVLQGYAADDYVRHVEMHRDAGVDMEQLFGVGSVCRRNGNPLEVLHILRRIREAAPAIQMHGFGLKTECLADARICHLLASADSMAWSLKGRMAGERMCSWCPSSSCANCLEYALLWRRQVLHRMRHEARQLSLEEAA